MSGGSMKEIQTRMKSIQGTRQITKAMQLVASSRLRRAKMQMEQAQPYFEVFQELIQKTAIPSRDSIFLTPTSEKRICFCVIAGDRGLAGGYNMNVFREVQSHPQFSNAALLPIGKKTAEFFRDKADLQSPMEVSAMNLEACFKLGQTLTDDFLLGRFDAFYLTYTQYHSAIRQTPVTLRVLPLDTAPQQYIEYDPSLPAMFKQVIPDYLAALLYHAVTQAYISELSSRQSAMDTATKNADDMLDSLRLRYNRARQAGITQEITEIISGSDF